MFYVLNKNAQISTGNHKIHTICCKRKPEYKNIIELHGVNNSEIALYEAKKYYPCVDGCKYCCKEIYLKK